MLEVASSGKFVSYDLRDRGAFLNKDGINQVVGSELSFSHQVAHRLGRSISSGSIGNGLVHATPLFRECKHYELNHLGEKRATLSIRRKGEFEEVNVLSVGLFSTWTS